MGVNFTKRRSRQEEKGKKENKDPEESKNRRTKARKGGGNIDI